MGRHKYGKPPELHKTKSYMVGDKIIHVHRREELLFHITLGDNGDTFKSMIKDGDVYYLTGGDEISIPRSWDRMLDDLGALDSF
jgi:hypothetical protein